MKKQRRKGEPKHIPSLELASFAKSQISLQQNHNRIPLVSSLTMSIEREISDALTPKLEIRSINSRDRLLTLPRVFNKILSAAIEEEEVTVKSFLLLDLSRVTTKMIQDNEIHLETAS